MAGSVNRVFLIGNIGGEPELRHAGATPVCTFNLATSERWTDSNGERQEKTEWHRCVAWARLAELCHEYLCKGRLVYVEGSLHTRTYTDKEGRERSTTEIKAREVQFLSGKGGA